MESLKRDLTSCKISASTVILDIEGTTTSISFVKDILFPYIRSNLEKFIDDNWGSDKLQENVKALRIQAQEDEENKVEGVVPIPEEGEDDTLKLALINNVKWQMDNDRKTKSLKDLQGVIMEKGYTTGDLKGHVYDDVEPSLKTWTELNKSIYIYSSGSVAAQKLLFGHSEKGDMLPLIKGHFDTNVGMKGDVSSYKEILKEISISPSEAVFFTDVPKEARAAKEAGILAVLVSREGNAPLSDEDKTEFQVITSFEDVEFETNCKKMKISPENLVPIDNKEIENCSFSIEDRQKPDPIIQKCVESEKDLNNDILCNGSSNSIELMEVDDSNAEKTSNCDAKDSADTKQEDTSIESKKEEPTETTKEEPTETMKEESTENKEEKSEVSKEESTEIIKDGSTDSVKEESIESMNGQATEMKSEESIQSVKEESLDKKEDSAESMKEELAEEKKKETLNESTNQNTMEDKKEESNEMKKVESIQNEMEVENEEKEEESTDSVEENSAEIIKIESDEGKKEEMNENMKQNPTENIQEETIESKEESTNTSKEISGEIRKEESIQTVKETQMESETNEVNSEESVEKKELAEGENKVPNEDIEQNSTENVQEESNERGKQESIQDSKEETIEDENKPTESIKEETTERNGEVPVIANGDIKTSNVDNDVTDDTTR